MISSGEQQKDIYKLIKDLAWTKESNPIIVVKLKCTYCMTATDMSGKLVKDINQSSFLRTVHLYCITLLDDINYIFYDFYVIFFCILHPYNAPATVKTYLLDFTIFHNHQKQF